MTVLLTRRATVQGAMETLYGQAAAVGVNDGILVGDPTYTADPEVLERNFTRDTLSPLASINGRKMAKMEFTTELRGNSKQQSGLAADAPIISRLFRACGYQLVPNTSPGLLGPYEIDVHQNAVSWGIGSGAKATGTITQATGPAANNDTVTINGQVYTFKTALTGAAYEVLAGANFGASASNLTAAINRGAGEGILYGAGTPASIFVDASVAGGVVTLTSDRVGTSGNALTLAKSGANTTVSAATLTGGTNASNNTDMIAYYLNVVTGGASGVAEVMVASDTQGEASAAAVITSGTPFTIGTKGLTSTPTFTGDLVVGQRWVVWLTPPGLLLRPVSENQESITLVMHKDRKLHTMPGAFGTFEIDATAGQYATVKWTFSGVFNAATDDPLPSPLFERTLPSMVELARLRTDSFNAIVNKFTFTQANDIQIRPDVSSAEGYIGYRLVGRTPTGGIDPEDDLVSNFDFWGKMAAATRMPFQMRVGKQVGNIVWMIAPSTQYTKMTYADRNGIQTYDAGLKFSGYQADDESMFFFH